MSYSEVKKFERCAAYSQGTDIPGITPGHLVQYLADNIDHNVWTMDGLIVNTFHGMGIIASVTPGTKRRDPVICDTWDQATRSSNLWHLGPSDEIQYLDILQRQKMWYWRLW